MIVNTPPLLPGDPERKKSSEITEALNSDDTDAIALGSRVEEQQPVTSMMEAAEAVLRQPRRVYHQLGEAAGARLTLSLFCLGILGLLGYGLVVGSFSGGDQMWAAPVKIAGGILASGIICLPSLYIFSCLTGSKASLRQIVGLVAGLIAIMTLLLIGFAPVAWVFSQSTESITMMGFLHLMFWTVAMYFAAEFFKGGFKAMVVERDNGVLKVWLTVFVVVVLQMSTALRPIIGPADSFLPDEKRFFIGHWFNSFETGVSRGARNSRN